MLKDFPTRDLLADHARQQGLDSDAVSSVLAWRDNIAESWGNQFAYEDGRAMTLYDAWQHGAMRARQAAVRSAEAPPLYRPAPRATGDEAIEPLHIRVPQGQGSYGVLMGRLMQLSLRTTPRMPAKVLAAKCTEWAETYPECREALVRAAQQFEAMQSSSTEELPF